MTCYNSDNPHTCNMLLRDSIDIPPLVVICNINELNDLELKKLCNTIAQPIFRKHNSKKRNRMIINAHRVFHLDYQKSGIGRELRERQRERNKLTKSLLE